MPSSRAITEKEDNNTKRINLRKNKKRQKIRKEK